MLPTTPDRRVLRAVVVASWFPAIDDTTKGRFVADQVEALRDTGAVDPTVISFEPAALAGGPLDRGSQAAAITGMIDPVLATHQGVFAASGWSLPTGIPVARLPIPNGNRAMAGPAHPVADRRHALALVAGSLASTGRTVIHAHTGYPDGAAATALMAPLGAPLVITEHAGHVLQQLAQPEARRAYLEGAQAAARIIAVSESMADGLRAALPEHAARIVVIPNTVRMDDLRPVGPGERDPGELLYVGYLTETKGLDILLAAFARARAARPALTLRLIGGAPTDGILAGWRRLATELGVADGVTFEGPQLRGRVTAALERASLLVHASRRESFGIAPVEALACGLPVVATATGGVRETMGPDPDALGALVPIEDPDALAAGILATLDRRAGFDPGVLRASVEGRFAGGAVAARIVDLYAAVLAEHERSAQRTIRAAGAPEGPHVASPPDPAEPPVDSRPGPATVVVAFDTPRIARLLAGLPPACLADLALVCSAGPAESELPEGLALVAAIDVAALQAEAAALVRPAGPRGNFLARVRRFAGDPRGALRRRSLRRRRDRAHADGVATTLARLAGERGGPIPEVVCLDGTDYLAAAPSVIAGSAVAVPGSLRWLADRWAAADAARTGARPTAPSPHAPATAAGGARPDADGSAAGAAAGTGR